jgi:hypothetical protein
MLWSFFGFDSLGWIVFVQREIFASFFFSVCGREEGMRAYLFSFFLFVHTTLCNRRLDFPFFFPQENREQNLYLNSSPCFERFFFSFFRVTLFEVVDGMEWDSMYV